MESLEDIIARVITEDSYKCILSGPVDKSERYRRIELDSIGDHYYVEKQTETQVFHEKMQYAEVKSSIQSLLGSHYRDLHVWSAGHEYAVRISKKGKVSLRDTVPIKAPPVRQAHNREKNYILKQGMHIEPLVDMGIFTREGKVVQAMYDKYRQINRFVEIVDDEMKKNEKDELQILDFGCGKSYLTFVLYYYFTEIKKINVKMIGLDVKRDVIEKCEATAEKYGYENLEFRVGDIGSYESDGGVDVVITLHACDTATDYALFNAIRWNADMIFSVPCCQHELNAQIESDGLALLTRYGIVKERFSSLMTDAIRCNLLECFGYSAQMIEFVAFDHTPKNIMIRATKRRDKTSASGNKKIRLAEVESVMNEFHVRPTLYRLLTDESEAMRSIHA